MARSLSLALLAPLHRLLERRPLANLYFLCRLERVADDVSGLEGRVVVVPDARGGIRAAADCGRNLVLELGEEEDDAALSSLVEAALRLERGRHALLGRRSLVARFQAMYARRGARVLEQREQILFDLDGRDLPDGTEPRLRTPRPYELDELLRAHSAMCLEDLGQDQVAENPAGYRQYFRQLIVQRRVWVVRDEGRIVFKAESGIEASVGAQIEGVWTDPAHRRRGLARRSLLRIARELLQRVPRVSLYVNEVNRAAIALYGQVGFREAGDWRTVLLRRE